MDIFEKCTHTERVQEAKAHGLYPYFVELTGNDGPVVSMDGREMIMIGSNNYLGLTHDPRVIEAAVQATRRYGTSCSGSRFLNGTLDIHVELEERIARFMGREAALIFSTGYQTNFGVLSALGHRNDILFIDKSDHASIYAGTRAGHGAVIRRYKHNDMDDLERVLQQSEADKGKMIVSDSVFSMEGDIVNLERMVELARQYNARVYLDEAHGVGVLGARGRGCAEYLRKEKEVDLIMSTFSKSFASLGGFITGEEYIITYLKHTAGSLIFSASPTPAATAAALKSLEIIEKEPERRENLLKNGDYMRRELNNIGLDTGKSSLTPIVPIYVHDDLKTFQFWRMLFENGVYTNPVVSPAVSPDNAMLRTSYMATHTREHLDRCLEVIDKAARKLGITDIQKETA
ncbi:MAG: aminotransferase class I/II-fold pyridoxal phosphate-dependent enzyme [Calditrichaeota bacterium]|nr:MAG: aminotransferase class I/II-fold pyridoxal phosphate-dependent enzyme [Calditrichota bacterium]